MNVIKFETKVSPILIATFIILGGMLTITSFLEDHSTWLEFILQLCSGLICFLVIVHLYSIKYTIEQDSLVIKAWFYKKVIPIDTITKIEYTFNPISSPAPAFKRLEIYFSKFDSIVISPKDRPYFIDQLQKLKPDIIIKQ